jgi:hypothetical protein
MSIGGSTDSSVRSFEAYLTIYLSTRNDFFSGLGQKDSLLLLMTSRVQIKSWAGGALETINSCAF